MCCITRFMFYNPSALFYIFCQIQYNVASNGCTDKRLKILPQRSDQNEFYNMRTAAITAVAITAITFKTNTTRPSMLLLILLPASPAPTPTPIPSTSLMTNTGWSIADNRYHHLMSVIKQGQYVLLSI